MIAKIIIDLSKWIFIKNRDFSYNRGLIFVYFIFEIL